MAETLIYSSEKAVTDGGDKVPEDAKIVINGAGAAGVAVTKIFLSYGAKNIIVCDSQGILNSIRDVLDKTKHELIRLGASCKNLFQSCCTAERMHVR